MECSNQPALAAIEGGEGKYFLTTKPNGADDGGWTHGACSFEAGIMSVPLNSLDYDLFSGLDIQRDCHSYPPDLNCLPDQKIDENLIDVKSDMSEFCRESEMSSLDESTRRFSYAIDGNNSVPSDCVMNTAITSMGYGNSEVHMNFTPPRCETATGYPIKAHGAEAKNSRVSRFHMSGKFSSSECCTSLLPPVDNFGATVNKNDINIVPLSFSSPQRVDRNFLTLEIGGGSGIRPNNNFSTREISSKLEEVFSQCNNPIVGHCSQNPFNLTQLTGAAARIQTGAGGLSSSACNLASRIPTRDEGGLIGDTGFRRNSIQFPGLQTPPSNALSNFFSGKRYTSAFEPTPLLLPFGSTLVSQPKCSTLPEITTSAHFAIQPTPRQQDYRSQSSMKISSESSRNYLSHRHKQSSISHVQLGNLDTYHDVSPVEALGNNLFPERIGFQIPKSSNFQSAAAGPFPRRLGLQPNDFAAAQSTRGSSPIHLAAQFNPYRPSVSAGQDQHGMPTQSSKDFPRVDHSNGQVTPVAKFDFRPQASPVVSHPSLKRKATEDSPATRSCQRSKIFPQHVKHHSTTCQSIPATPATVHIPPAPLHVKWQGFDTALEPTGQKCLLCKRDLSFTADGQLYQPAAPLAVAVLPCGHTFHDHCLQIITPQDQSICPPCIPCAFGEK